LANGKRSHQNVKTTVVEGALEPWFRGRRMSSITTADIRAYVADRQTNGYADATINRELAALKRMYTLAIQAGKLIQRPHIPMLADATRLIRHWRGEAHLSARPLVGRRASGARPS
jgi:site-specific recombinase XerC